MLIATTWTLDFSTSDIDKLENIVYVNEIMSSIVRISNFKVVDSRSKKFEPIGLTSMFLLEESHLSIHTWPEYNFFCIDIFTCKPLTNIEKIIQLILASFDDARLISKSSMERKTSANIGIANSGAGH